MTNTQQISNSRNFRKADEFIRQETLAAQKVRGAARAGTEKWHAADKRVADLNRVRDLFWAFESAELIAAAALALTEET